MDAFTPLAFAKAMSTVTPYGVLFIQTSNPGAQCLYSTELSNLGEEAINALACSDAAFVIDLEFDEAEAILRPLQQNFNADSPLSFAAIFFDEDGDIADTWYGGACGEDIHNVQIRHFNKKSNETMSNHQNSVTSL